MKKTIALLMTLMLITATAAGCGSGSSGAPAAADTGATAQTEAGEAGKTGESGQEGTTAENGAPIADGMYQAEFNTDGSMFHVNETKDGKGILIVSDGKMTIHVVMPSKNTVNLFCGTAEDAQKEGAAIVVRTNFITAKIYTDFKVDFYRYDGKTLCRDYRGKMTRVQRFSPRRKPTRKRFPSCAIRAWSCRSSTWSRRDIWSVDADGHFVV